MTITFPSPEFDEAVTAVCHGQFSEDLAHSLNQLLRSNAAALDEYILRLELHSRLSSDPDLFAVSHVPLGDFNMPTGNPVLSSESLLSEVPTSRVWFRRLVWGNVAAMLVLFAALGWWWYSSDPVVETQGTTRKAVAMLDKVVDARWSTKEVRLQGGAPMVPGEYHLESGMVQVLFYNGARVVIEGPSQFDLIHSGEMSIRNGRLIAEVAPQAIGFRVLTPQTEVIDLGTAFGMEVTQESTEVHVIEGSVELAPLSGDGGRVMEEGMAIEVEALQQPHHIIFDVWKFASLFELQPRSLAAEASLYQQWRHYGEVLNKDPSLLFRLDFEDGARNNWKLRNACHKRTSIADGTVIGCQWTSGRWPGKRALEFQSVNDRVRLGVPGEYESLTLSMWLRVQGLDRRINSLFMSDGFAPGTIHWSIRNDGVLGLTLIGQGFRNYEIAATPPVVTLNQLGMWVHLAVVVDGPGQQIVQYFNGSIVGTHHHQIHPPYSIGQAELGNWNAEGFDGNDPFHIRNFSGAMDEFCLFGRALNHAEVRELFQQGNPQPESLIQSQEARTSG